MLCLVTKGKNYQGNLERVPTSGELIHCMYPVMQINRKKAKQLIPQLLLTITAKTKV